MNFYSEIKDLPSVKREQILEEARYEAFVKLKLSGISALFFFGSLIVFFIPVGLSIVYFGYFSYPTLVSFFTLFIGQHFLNGYLQSKLIRKGLIVVLSRNDV